MTNKEIIYEILKVAEEKHLDLYHDVAKESVLEYVKNLKDVDGLSAIEFERELCKLFALFRDAHTFYEIPIIRIDKEIVYNQGKMYLKEGKFYHEIVEVDCLSTDAFIKEMSKLMNYEVKEYLFDSLRAGVKNLYYYQMVLGEEKSGFNIQYINQISQKIETVYVSKLNGASKKRAPNYQFEIIDEKILYLKYKKCFEDENYPFSQFMKELKEVVKKNNIKNYILDLRNNHGGDSEMINPFQDFVKNNQMQGILLVNNGTFSSGRIAVARFKKLFQPTIIGQPTGGAIKSFGYSKHYEVCGKRFTVSVYKWDFSKIFGYTGAIQPDILVEETITDLRGGVDRQLESAVVNIQNNYICKNL